MIGTCLGGLTVHKPKTLEDASAILTEHGDDAAVIAGGTDILVDLRVQRRKEHHLVSLRAIPDLCGVSQQQDCITIGSSTTLNELLASDCITTLFPALHDAASAIGSYQIRNTATIGGNIASGVPCADLPPVLLVLNASIIIATQNGDRIVPIKDFFLNVRSTCINTGEIMRGISIPTQPKNSTSVFERFDLRQGNSLAVASVACSITMDGDTIKAATIALGAVAPVPTLVPNVEDLLVGNTCNDAMIAEVSALAMEAAMPISDLRSSAEYRKEIIGILTTRAVKRAVESA